MARRKTGVPIQEKVLSFRVFPEEFHALDELQRQTGRSRSEIFRSLLYEHLERHGIELPAREGVNDKSLKLST